METKLLIIGKGDNIITMILDNLYSNGTTPTTTIYNNLKLHIQLLMKKVLVIIGKR